MLALAMSPASVSPASALDPEVLLPLREFLRLLPGTHAQAAHQLLADAWFDALVEGGEVLLAGRSLGPADGDDALFVARDTAVACVTPYGAERLVAAYRQGALPRTASVPGKLAEPAPAAVAYANSYATLARQSRERAKEQRRAAALRADRPVKFESLVKNPEAVPESKLDYELLDAIFREHRGPGSGTMHIGGIAITRSFACYSGNSGKNSSHAVRFEWVSANGACRVVDTPRQREAHRHNDEHRNWGRPRPVADYRPG